MQDPTLILCPTPVEIDVFMRAVKSRTFFEQMKGLGVHIMKDDDLHKEVKVCRLQYKNLCSRAGISDSPRSSNSRVTTY
jgi:hypothetical protein